MAEDSVLKEYAALAPQSWWESACEDGGRFFEKVNRNGVLIIEEREVADRHVRACPEAEDFAWVSRDVLTHARQMGWLNFHLRSVLSMLL